MLQAMFPDEAVRLHLRWCTIRLWKHAVPFAMLAMALFRWLHERLNCHRDSHWLLEVFIPRRRGSDELRRVILWQIIRYAGVLLCYLSLPFFSLFFLFSNFFLTFSFFHQPFLSLRFLFCRVRVLLYLSFGISFRRRFRKRLCR